MKKKIVAMLLSITIVAVMLQGCGQFKSDAASTDTAPTDTATTTVERYETENESACESVASSESAAYDNSASSYATSEEATRGYGVDAMPSVERAGGTSVAEESEMLDEMLANNGDYEWYEGDMPNKVAENNCVLTTENALSTFGADVDTASYTNLRRMVNDGYSLSMIPADMIRTEEIVNYFNYNYAEPKEGEVFAVNAVVSSCPWNKQAKLMSIGINTADMDSKEIPDCNIVFLVDVSGSMKGEKKLPLIQKTMAMLSDNFDDNDRISIVTYASGVETVLDGCKGGDSRKIIKAFEGLSAQGSTNGGDGIKLAYKVAQKHFIKGGVNRVIICSDGDFNVGLTTQAELEKLISNKKDSGIFLSTLGFGMNGYSDATMETLADKGNGNYAYIDDLTEAKRVLVDEMSSTFVTVAKDVKFQVEFNPAVVSKYRLIGYENRVMAAKDFKDDTKDGGEMGAGHQVTALYEIYTDDAEEETSLKYQESNLSKKGALGDEFCTLSIAYKEPNKDKSNYLEYPIGTNHYTSNPSNDFKLATAAAQASLAIRNSDIDALTSSMNIVKKLGNAYTDEYVTEFGELLETLANNEYYVEWYE